jgi:hypothetical protein
MNPMLDSTEDPLTDGSERPSDNQKTSVLDGSDNTNDANGVLEPKKSQGINFSFS